MKPSVLLCTVLLLLLPAPGSGAAPVVVFADDMEGDPLGAGPVADIGSYQDANGRVTDSATAGIPANPSGGSQFVQISRSVGYPIVGWATEVARAETAVHLEFDMYVVKTGEGATYADFLVLNQDYPGGHPLDGTAPHMRVQDVSPGIGEVHHMYTAPAGSWHVNSLGTQVTLDAWHHYELDCVIGEVNSMFIAVDGGTPVNIPPPWGWLAYGARNAVTGISGLMIRPPGNNSLYYGDNIQLTLDDPATAVRTTGVQDLGVLSFQSERGQTYRLEMTGDPVGGTWTAADWTLCGDGSARHVVVPVGPGAADPTYCRLRAGEACDPSMFSLPWEVGTPIITYWAGPPMTDATARQMAEGGWNLVWCNENELEVVRRHGLRGLLTDPLLTPDSLDDPSRLDLLDALIARVQDHPGLYAYHLVDEPNAAQFPALGRLVAHLRERDRAHLAYINLFPTYASNEQLGTPGDTVTAYQEYLRRYVDMVEPALISYDHYQFTANGDGDQYFLNLDLIRGAAQQAGVPFLNIVQACSWTPSMRVPGPDEMRYLLYTTLAYAAQGISYYVYSYPGHTGGIALADGTPTPLYHALKPLHREFTAVAAQLQTLRPVGVHHAGMTPPGTEPLPADFEFALEPPVPAMEYHPPEPVKGVLLGCYGPGAAASPTHVLVVNLDYAADAVVGVRGPAPLERFDAVTGDWSPVGGTLAELQLPRGGGALLRVGPEPLGSTKKPSPNL